MTDWVGDFPEPVDPVTTGSENAFCLLSADDEVVYVGSVLLCDQRAVEGLLLLGCASLSGPDHAVELRGCLLGALNDRLQHTGNHLTLLDRRNGVIVPVKAEHLDIGELALFLQGIDAPKAISSLPAMTPCTSGFLDNKDSIFSWPSWRSQLAISLPTCFRSGYCEITPL